MPEINPQRLLNDLKHLRTIGTFSTGVVRPTYSSEDMEARRWLCRRMDEAGLQSTIDGVGNVMGRSSKPGKAVLIGSHTDTQPQGGWLDGTLGVIYGLEIARAFAEDKKTAGYSVDVASWSDEEGTYLGMLGSRSFCGVLNHEEIEIIKNHQSGVGLKEVIKKAGIENTPLVRLEPDRYLAYLEAHIEQGPHLDAQELYLGVVTGIAGIRTFKLTFRGEQNHAGSTPMEYRKDAAASMFAFAQRIDQEFSTLTGPRTTWTKGHVRVEPGSPSVVPGMAEISLQFRDTDEGILAVLESRTAEIVKQTHRQGPVQVTMEAVYPWTEPAWMDDGLQEHLAAAAEAIAPGKWIHMPSGAGHDAMILASHLPSAMLFIPSIGGISHDIAEDTSEDDIVRGCRVLAAATEALLDEAGVL